jgi:hypothetical protein
MDNDTAFPSSPPHATAYDPPSPPFFESRPYYGAYSPKSSSPAPIFSSDDSHESHDVTNYESPRVKNKRKGAWYETDRGESSMTTPEPKKSRIARNNDSAIYMLSDMSASSVNLIPEHHVPFPFADGGCDVEQPRTSAAEALFSSRLREGLEKDSQSYDFTNMDLTDGDIKYVSDLSSVINNPPDPGNDLPVESQYRSMAPELFVNFANNNLRRLTPSLFHLEHLTSLTLRNNDIEELPPQIGQLRNLKALDVSLNKLRQLPFELIRLAHPFGKLERITTMGNPLLQPVPWTIENESLMSATVPDSGLIQSMGKRKSIFDELQHKYADDARAVTDVWRIRLCEIWIGLTSRPRRRIFTAAANNPAGLFAHHPEPVVEDSLASMRHMARTLVTYYDQAGVVVKGSPTLPISNSDDYPIIIETRRGTWGVPKSPIYSPPAPSRVASLATSCLNVALKQETLEETTHKIGEPVPFDIAAILSRAARNDAGLRYGYFRQCHVCQKDYIVARAEWIELWANNSSIFPLSVKVCSWGCVPTEMTKQPEVVLE